MSSCTWLMSVFGFNTATQYFEWAFSFAVTWPMLVITEKERISQYTVTNYFFLHWTKIDWVRIETSSQNVIQLLVLISKCIDWFFFSSLHSKKSKAQNMETFFFQAGGKTLYFYRIFNHICDYFNGMNQPLFFIQNTTQRTFAVSFITQFMANNPIYWWVSFPHLAF